MEEEEKSTIPLEEFQGNWDTIAQHLQRQFPNLKNQDLRYFRGEEEQLVQRLSRSLNIGRNEIIRLIKQG